MGEIRIGVVGAGIIGATHLDALGRSEGFRLGAIVDPGPAGPGVAAARGVPHFGRVEEMIAAGVADAAIVATPNELHVPVSAALLEAGLPVLLEKPIANTVAEAMALLAVERRTGVPLLVGHHRRHNPIVRAAKAAIDGGAIGRLVMASVVCTLYKDAAYFDVPWRRTPGVGGPVFINMIHEIDLMRHLFGDVAAVSAVVSNRVRGLPVEDTAVAMLRFTGGGVASLSVSDTAVGPWAWDITAGENLGRFPAHPAQSHFLAGTEGGLSLPDLSLWAHGGEKSWAKTLERRSLPFVAEDVYVAQTRHFGEVIAGRATPLVSGLEATKDLATAAAILAAAASGREVEVVLAAGEAVA